MLQILFVRRLFCPTELFFMLNDNMG